MAGHVLCRNLAEMGVPAGEVYEVGLQSARLLFVQAVGGFRKWYSLTI